MGRSTIWLNVIQHPLELRPPFNAFAAFAFFNISIKNRHTPTLGAFSQIVLLPIQTIPLYLTCVEDGLDSSTSMGKMMITILGAVAELERENIIAQSLLGREEKAKSGGWNGGFAPYGYRLVKGNWRPSRKKRLSCNWFLICS